MQQRPVDAAAGQPGGAPDQDFEYKWSDPDDTGASYDRDPVTEPIPVAEVQNLVPDQPDDYAWDDHDEVPAGSVEIPPEPVDVYDLVPEQPDDHEWDDDRDEVPPAAVEVRPLRARPLAAGDLVHPAVGMPMPEYLPQPWYRTKQAVTVLAAAAVAAVMCGGWLVLRSPSTTAEQSTIDAPTSAPPAPSRVQPTAVSAPSRPRLRHLLLHPRRRLSRPIQHRNGSIRSRGAVHRRPEQRCRRAVRSYARHPGADQRGTGAAAGCRK